MQGVPRDCPQVEVLRRGGRVVSVDIEVPGFRAVGGAETARTTWKGWEVSVCARARGGGGGPRERVVL